MCACLTTESIQCISAILMFEMQHREDQAISLCRDGSLLQPSSVWQLCNQNTFCAFGFIAHISHIFKWCHIPGVDTVLHCEVMCLAWSLSSICVVFFIDSHYIGSHVWCTARGLRIIGACLSHSHVHRRTNNTNIIKWSSQLSALQHQKHLVVDSIYVKVQILCKKTACLKKYPSFISTVVNCVLLLAN